MTVALIYLARHIFLPIIVFALARKSQSGDLFYLLGGTHANLYMLVSLPALMVLVIWGRRGPASPELMRWAWRRGRRFIALSALLDLGLRLTLTANLFKGLAIAQCLLDFYILVYLRISPRVRQVFEDFPEPPQTTSPRDA